MNVRRMFGMVMTKDSGRYTTATLESFFSRTQFQSETDHFLLIDIDAAGKTEDLRSSFSGIEIVTNLQPKSFAENGNLVISRASETDADAYFLNNDVIFPPDWIAPLDVPMPAVLAPTSNQNFQYRHGALETKPVMKLEEYVGKEKDFEEIVAQHRLSHFGYDMAYKTNFFTVKIPSVVYKKIGGFDTTFGVAGGEDDDYCIRAYLGGFSVQVAVQSYCLHFGGKSTWDGPESKEKWREREAIFIRRFQEKWGQYLAQFLLTKDARLIDRYPEFKSALAEGGIAALFAAMRNKESNGGST